MHTILKDLYDGELSRDRNVNWIVFGVMAELRRW